MARIEVKHTLVVEICTEMVGTIESMKDSLESAIKTYISKTNLDYDIEFSGDEDDTWFFNASLYETAVGEYYPQTFWEPAEEDIEYEADADSFRMMFNTMIDVVETDVIRDDFENIGGWGEY